jgi:hypothetical protein
MDVQMSLCIGDSEWEGTVFSWIPLMKAGFFYPLIEINSSNTVLSNFVITTENFGIGLLLFNQEYIEKQVAANKEAM